MFADQAHELIVFNDVLMKYVPLVLDSDFFSREFGDNDQAILVSSLVLILQIRRIEILLEAFCQIKMGAMD